MERRKEGGMGGWAGEKTDRGGKKGESKELETQEGGKESRSTCVCEYETRWLNPGGVSKDDVFASCPADESG